MGMFKRMKQMSGVLQETPEMIRQAKEMQAQGMQAQAEAARVMNGEVSEELLIPIEGVDLNTYARCAKKQVEGGLLPEEFDAWLATQGLTPKQYAVAASGWVTRMRENLALSTRYGAIYQHTPSD